MRFAALLCLIGTHAILLSQSSEATVKAVLDAQVKAWNEGNLKTFVKTYSPDAVFVGKDVSRGTAELLERYRRKYPTREYMGTLHFTGIEVRMLGRDFASVLGRYQLDRTLAGGGPAAGIFTLLLKRSGKTWSIILDHTS